MEPSLQLSLAAESPPGLRRGPRGAQEAITARLSVNIDTSFQERRRGGRGFPRCGLLVFLAAGDTFFFFVGNVRPDMREYAGDFDTSAGC